MDSKEMKAVIDPKTSEERIRLGRLRILLELDGIKKELEDLNRDLRFYNAVEGKSNVR